MSEPLLGSSSLHSGAASPTPVCSRSLRCRAGGIVTALVLCNLGCFAGLGLVARRWPAFLSPGVLAFTFGLRHAVDADHIAAIDNVSRRLISAGRRPLLVGFWFSLGHSTVVVLLCAGVAFGSTYLREHLSDVKSVGALVGTSVSAAVLLLVAGLNIFVAWKLVKRCRRMRRDQRGAKQGESNAACAAGSHVHVTSMGSVLEHSHPVSVNEDGDAVDGPGGVFSRCCPKLFGAVSAPWKMYPIGFLFGLGFDTSSEVALLGLTAMGTQKDLPAAAIMLLPCLFAAGMSLIDTLDGMMMLVAYSWAASDPLKRVFFNLFLTVVSALIALVVAVLEVLGLVQARMGLHGWFWDGIKYLADHFEYVGYGILAFFALSCVAAAVMYRCCAGGDGGGRQMGGGGGGGGGGEGGGGGGRETLEKGVVIGEEADGAAGSSSSSVDDYLRKRMLGLAYGEAKAIDI
jgi:high-affinity nickel-transport protein